MKKEVEIYGKKWAAEIEALRGIFAATELTEEEKWCKPCYTLAGKNVALIGPFKEFCAVTFFKGALMKDPAKMLHKIGQNTQAGRWAKFTSAAEISKNKKTIKAYIEEAIALEKSGAKVVKKTPAEHLAKENFPVELLAAFRRHPGLKKSFEGLTPGRQRAYLLHFNGAKQSATREARIEKYAPQILEGYGILDGWKKKK